MEATPGDGRCAARQRRQEVQEGRGKKGGRGRDVHRYGRENTRAKKEGKGGQGCGRQRRRKEGNGGAVEGEERRREQGDARAGKAAKRERGEERRGLPPPRDGWQGCVGGLAVGAAAVQPVPYTPARAAAAARRREAVGGASQRGRGGGRTRRGTPAPSPQRPLQRMWGTLVLGAPRGCPATGRGLMARAARGHTRLGMPHQTATTIPRQPRAAHARRKGRGGWTMGLVVAPPPSHP